MKKIASRVANHPKVIARGRLWGESLACIYVGLETHFVAFQVILAVWLIIDLGALIADLCGFPIGE